MKMQNYGHVYGRPRIKVGYGKSIGKVKQNITRKSDVKMKQVGGSKQSFGYGR